MRKRIVSTMMALLLIMTLVPVMSAQAAVNYGVGKGVEWPKQVMAPFADVVSWVTKPGYNNSGVANMGRIADETGVKFYNFGFIQAASTTVTNGRLDWGFGGYHILSEAKADDEQYKGIKKAMTDIRGRGGDFTISFGGAAGTAFWEATKDVTVLTNTYIDLVEGFGLTRIDLDIEGAAQNKAANIANAKAIKKLQDATKVEVTLTLPVLPNGLTTDQLNVLEAYLTEGVRPAIVNLMTMCYGPSTLLPGENYGTASLRAVDSTKDQLIDYYKRFANTTLTSAQAYALLGTTNAIGYESSAHPIFTADWSQLVTNHAKEKGLALVSYWSMNRDAQLEPNSGIKGMYEFTNIYKSFAGNATPSNTAPTLKGVDNVTIAKGTSFDVRAGVTATDQEDGDVTAKIAVVGSVDTAKGGTYSLTYSVADSKGLTTKATRIVTVQDPNADTFDATKVYNSGDKVVYKGATYIAQWWTQGGTPETNSAWKLVVIPNPDGSVNYVAGTAYNSGSLVRYNGATYKANWWTNTVPGSDTSWTKVN